MSPMGDITNTMGNPPIPAPEPVTPPAFIPVLARAEQNLYTKTDREITEDIKEIQKRFKRFAKNMAIMRDRRLYFAGGYATFEEYCQKKLGKSRQYIYK